MGSDGMVLLKAEGVILVHDISVKCLLKRERERMNVNSTITVDSWDGYFRYLNKEPLRLQFADVFQSTV